jgi:DNA-binding CsgD family transcriptional regulator
MEEAIVAKSLTVPVNLVPRVREGAYGLLAAGAEAIVRSAHAHEQPGPMSCADVEHALALLGRVGWSGEQDTEEAIELAREHGAWLHAAIETMNPLLTEWLDELDPDDASRPDRAEELRAVQQLAVGVEVVLGETPVRGLTPRESEVFARLRMGRTYIEIGDELHISPATVRTHTGKICRKLQVHGKRELIGLVLPIGL